MNETLLQLYHRLPSPLRSTTASLHGLYLRFWRYSSRTEQLVEEALEREHWSPDRWRIWQEERLAYVLHRAATQVPYYREQWEARRRRGDHASWSYLENWPVLEKEPLRQNPTAFVAEDRNRRYMYHEHTSGTTGKPLELWWSRETVQAWYALFEARTRRWNNVSRHDRWAILGGQLIAPVDQSRPPFWAWNAALNQLYMSSYHLSMNYIRYYLDALLHYRITYLLGYTSSLHALAQGALHWKSDFKPCVAITNAEPVLDYQRQVIAEAFQCPVRETYGMSEIVAAASECQEGGLHLWPEVGLVEVSEGSLSGGNGTCGELVCTGLLNADMPLIRYRVGDHGTLRPTDISCSCGRTLRVLASLEGRVDDVLYTSDGRRIGRLDPMFKARLPIREAQIIQEALDLVRVRYVPAPDFTPESERSIIERLQALMGAVKVILEPVNEVPRGANGKFRAVICSLPTRQIIGPR